MKKEQGMTLIEVLAAIVILSLIIGPLLTISFNTFKYTLQDGERNQTTNIAQQVLNEYKPFIIEEYRGKVNQLPNDWTEVDISSILTRPEYADYEIKAFVKKHDSTTPNLAALRITTNKKNSSFSPIIFKTVVRIP